MDRFNSPENDDLIQPQTPEELKKLAESLADLPKGFQISAEELEMLDEELHGKLMRYGTPAKAIQAMERRLSVLRQQKAETLSALEICDDKDLRKTLTNDLGHLTLFISTVQTRLENYKIQQRLEN